MKKKKEKKRFSGLTGAVVKTSDYDSVDQSSIADKRHRSSPSCLFSKMGCSRNGYLGKPVEDKPWKPGLHSCLVCCKLISPQDKGRYDWRNPSEPNCSYRVCCHLTSPLYYKCSQFVIYLHIFPHNTLFKFLYLHKFMSPFSILNPFPLWDNHSIFFTVFLPSEACGPNESLCLDGSCILRESQCNGKKDCPFGLDERYCEGSVALNLNPC